MKIVVFGGSGYVGQQIVKAAFAQGVRVTSISRTGAPLALDPSLQGVDDAAVRWKRADIFNESQWVGDLTEADAVISCLGAFGSNQFMERINGDANISAISKSSKAGVPRFVYISSVENNLPAFILRGYFSGKRRTEEALLDCYPRKTGVILRPGFIFGTRTVPLPSYGLLPSYMKLNLEIVGRPLQLVLSNSLVRRFRESAPGMLAPLAIPVSVEDVAKVALAAALGKEEVVSRDSPILSDADILSISTLLK